jgi:leucyl/phenylalanyl-tRNA--protein transferase
MFLLDEKMKFPPTHLADADGWLAMGGDLSVERLKLAYSKGVFPWYNEDEPILWWTPDPRCVLFPENLQISQSMQQVLRKNRFEFRYNTAFERVMKNCRLVSRTGQQGTWIQDEMIIAYSELNRLGLAVSGECWENGALVGGLYGVYLQGVFFGESMFHHQSNASKFAFIHTVKHLQSKGLKLIDCQQATSHLISLGAELISRETFEALLDQFLEN